MENQMRRIGTIGRNYEVTTASGTYRVENTPGGSRGRNWLVFKPGQSVAASSQPTKSEALRFIDQDSKAATDAVIGHSANLDDTRTVWGDRIVKNANRVESHFEIKAFNSSGEELWISGEDSGAGSRAVDSIFEVVQVLATMPRTAQLVFDEGPSETHAIAKVDVSHFSVWTGYRGEYRHQMQLIETIKY